MFGKNPKIETEVQSLVSQILAEPFAESQQLAEATLDQLGRTLEEAATDYERPDLPPSLTDIAASFQRCKDLYCQILLDLESLTGTDWEQKPLTELAQTAAAATAPLAEEAPAIALGEEISDETNVESFENTVVTEAPVLPEFAAPTELPDAPEFIVPPTTDEVDAAEKVSEPSIPTVPMTPIPPLTPGPEMAPVAMPVVAAVPALPKTVVRDMGFGQRAKEAQLISEWLRSIAPKEPSSLDSTQLTRVSVQLLGNALELECWDRMRDGVSKIWEKRESAIKRLLDAKKSPWCLPQATKDQLTQFEKAIFKKPSAKPLPFFAMENSLRYLHSLPRLEGFYPSLLDAGTLLFFFGQKRELREYQLENHFWTLDTKLAECTEAALRLIRFHDQHRKTLTPWPSAGESVEPEKIEDEIEHILELFGKIELRRGR